MNFKRLAKVDKEIKANLKKPLYNIKSAFKHGYLVYKWWFVLILAVIGVAK